MGLLSPVSFIVHILLQRTSKAFTLSVLLLGTWRLMNWIAQNDEGVGGGGAIMTPVFLGLPCGRPKTVCLFILSDKFWKEIVLVLKRTVVKLSSQSYSRKNNNSSFHFWTPFPQPSSETWPVLRKARILLFKLLYYSQCLFFRLGESSSHAGDEATYPEEECDVHFQPIVQLPDKVDLITGEEEEIPTFVGRGKLYRFDTELRQWKERGVGDMKIMHSHETDVFRIVMRRDQIHKVLALLRDKIIIILTYL